MSNSGGDIINKTVEDLNIALINVVPIPGRIPRLHGTYDYAVENHGDINQGQLIHAKAPVDFGIKAMIVFGMAGAVWNNNVLVLGYDRLNISASQLMVGELYKFIGPFL